MKHPLHVTFGCMSIAFVCALGVYEAHHSPALAQSIPLPTVIGDDDNRSIFSVESEVAPYKGSNIADAYKNGYSVLYANKSAKAKWVLPVSTATSYCVAISLPKHQLFLPEQTYKIYDGATGDSLLATVNLKQSQAAGTSSCGARLESSSTRWLETGTKVTSKTGTVRVEMTHAGVPSATTYLVLDAVELRPSGSITVPPVGLCGNGKMEGSEQCDDGNQKDGDGCSANCTLESVVGQCTSSAQCKSGEYCTTETGDCLSPCKAGQSCQSVCAGVCKKKEAGACGNGKVEAGEQCDDGNKKDGDGCSANCTKEVICPAIACLPPHGCTTGTNANGCPDCSVVVCPNNPLRSDNDTARFDVAGETRLFSNQSAAIGGSFRVAHRSWMPSAKAVWNFPNLSPGQTYEIRVSTPPYEGSARSVLYRVYDGRTEIGTFDLADFSGGGAGGGSGNSGGGGVKAPTEHWLFMNKTFTSKTGTINILLSASEQKDKGWLVLDAIELVKSDRVDIGFCGDGLVSGNEQCDDMNNVSGDGCSASCTKESIGQMCTSDSQCSASEYCTTKDGECLSACKKGEACAAVCYGVCKRKTGVGFCGDGIVGSNEQCDDGNKKDGDGCNANCGVENGWQCSTDSGGGTSGGVQGGGSMGGGGQTVGGGGGSNGNMPVEYNRNGRSYCTRVISVGFCGDGRVSGTEQCDDGNVKNDDGCSAKCEVEVRDCTPPKLTGAKYQNPFHGADVNGDGRVNHDDSYFFTKVWNWKDAKTFLLPVTGFTTPPTYLNVNGSRNAAGQEDVTMSDLSTIIFYASQCQDSLPTCGNGKVEGTEQCDNGSVCNNGASCNSNVECRKCIYVARYGEKFCGGSTNSSICTTDADCMAETELMCTYNGAKDSNCDSQCRRKVSVGFCGNGKVESREGCDDGNKKDGDGCNANCGVENGWQCSTDSGGGTSGGVQGGGSMGGGGQTVGGGGGSNGNMPVEYNSNGRSYCTRVISVGFCGDGICTKDEEQMLCPACAMPRPGDDPAACACTQVCAKDCGGTNRCGNGKVEGVEQCDDGNVKNGDGCDASCKLEFGVGQCTSSAQCKTGEYCDTSDCLSPCKAGQPCQSVCAGVCKKKETGVCGNGKMESSEQCDDGNRQGFDGCSADCRMQNSNTYRLNVPAGVKNPLLERTVIDPLDGLGYVYFFSTQAPYDSLREDITVRLPRSNYARQTNAPGWKAEYEAESLRIQTIIAQNRRDAQAWLDLLAQPCAGGDCEPESTLFSSGRGAGKYDQMTYASYRSSIVFTPQTDMLLEGASPDVYYCNGQCDFFVSISQNRDILASAKDSMTKNANSAVNTNMRAGEMVGAFSAPVLLKAGGKYTVDFTIGSTKSVGIFTAGGTSPNARNGGSFTITSARSDSADHRGRGPVGFSFYGTADSPIANDGYFTGHKFECYDGYKEDSNSKMPMCMHADEWWNLAQQSCKSHCNTTKCGVNSWQVTGSNCTPQAVNPSTKVKTFVDTSRDGQFSNIEISSAIRRMAADMKLSGSTSASLASDFDGNGRVDVADFEYLAELIGMTPIR